MSGTIFTVVFLLTGTLLCGVGLYYRGKEKQDPEGRRIYTVTACVGAALLLIAVLRVVLGR